MGELLEQSGQQLPLECSLEFPLMQSIGVNIQHRGVTQSQRSCGKREGLEYS